jgi:hypothetical protein
MAEEKKRTSVRVVSRDDVRHFAVSINAMDPIHHDVAAARAAGFRDLVGPPNFFVVLGLSLGRVLPSSELRADGMPKDDEAKGRLVAGESAVEWFGDIIAGDEVVMTEQLEGTFVKEGRSGTLKGFRHIRLYEIDGRVVVKELLTRIAR